MSVFVTGDLHGDIKAIYTIPKRCSIQPGDTLIVAGDFGVPWSIDNIKRWRIDREIIKWFDDQPFTVAFVDGNHENFDLLDNFPYEEKWNGRVQRISNHVYHLCRGEIYIMEGHSIFTFGGATSVDKMYRTENISWWKAENASKSEMDYGVNTLRSVHWKVDYVITHTAPEQFFSVYQHASFGKELLNCPTQSYLTELCKQLRYKKWYFGHYHDDVESSFHKCRLLFEDIVKLGE